MTIRKTFVIGDVHGHWNELNMLMENLQKEDLDPDQDRVIFLGDFADGGPDVKTIIEKMIAWQEKYPHWKFIKGNHDDIMVDWIRKEGRYHSEPGWDVWLDQGGRATIQSYFPDENLEELSPLRLRDYAEKIPEEHVDWLDQLPLYFEDNSYFYVHAGLVPDLSIEDHKKAVADHNKKITQQMFWIREEFIRDIDKEWGKKIIYGHTTFGEPLVMDNKIGIDTMGRFEGKLTALELPAEYFYFQESLQDPSF